MVRGSWVAPTNVIGQTAAEEDDTEKSLLKPDTQAIMCTVLATLSI